LLTATGEVYAWGSNSHGQLALPNTVISQATMTKVIFPGDDDPEIVDIAAGHAHSLAVTSMGEVFTWGFNLYGQIGDGTQTTLGTNRNKYTPTKVTFDSLELDEKVINVFGSAGHSSFALTNQGRLFSWGRSAYGSLGLGAVPHQTRPQRIQFPGMEVDEHIDAVTIGGLHAFAQTSLKRWYAWGFNYAGQLGHGTYVDVNVPIRLDDSIFPWQTVRTMSAGSNFTLLVTEAEQVYSFGVNQSGQLGIGSFTNQAIPTAVLIDNLDVNDTVTTVTAAGLQSYVTTAQGRIFVWGDNPYPLMDEIAEEPFATPLDITDTLITYLGLF
jgi:alpha-tubulin suppressor-like RCC1 family protein